MRRQYSVYARDLPRASQMNALFRSVLAALFAFAVAQAAAQSYPAKPVHIVVPFPPVGAADLLTRALGKKLTETWGQPVSPTIVPAPAQTSAPKRSRRAHRTGTRF